MTQTQKKVLEWPLIILILLVVQSLEVSVLRLPGLGPIHFVPVLIGYIAVTREWGWVVALSFIFAFLGSSSVGYPWPVYVAAQVWTALTLKVILQTFAVEGRRQFTGLAALGAVIATTITYVLLKSVAKTLPLPLVLRDIVTTTAITAPLAYVMFPLFAAWDAYFEHEADESRELKPGALR